MADTRIRPATPGDRDYILATWCASALEPAHVRGWPRRLLLRGLHGLAAASDVRVVCLTDSPAYVLGWAAIEGDCVHWAYVRDLYRGSGLARSLVRDCKTTSQNVVQVSWLNYDPKRIEVSK